MNSSDPEYDPENEPQYDPELDEEIPAEEELPEEELEALEDENSDGLDGLEADLMKWRDLAHRTAADLDNYRKRVARERTESSRYANQALLEELLPVLDNFEMGMQAASQEQGSMIYIGMNMVGKQFDEFLDNNGVKLVPAEGQPFDPNLHEAVSEEETSEVPDGTIVRVIRRGYSLRDRLLRPATVVVAKSASEGSNEKV